MKLFSNAYHGLHGKDELRIYFEDKNIGLFVWINEKNELPAFQADYNNEISFHFNRPNKIGIGRINNEPISGGITGELTDSEVNLIKEKICALDNEEFKGIFKIIKDAVQQRNIDSFIIPKSEIKKINRLNIESFLGKGKKKRP